MDRAAVEADLIESRKEIKMRVSMMQLQGMDDQTYYRLLDEVNDIRYLIVKSGKMATKTKVENVLMARYDFNRSDAHSLVNSTEAANVRDFMVSRHGVRWQAKRPEPRAEDWPELETVS